MPFITQGKTNWKFLLIVLILAVIIGGVIWLLSLPIPPPWQPPPPAGCLECKTKFVSWCEKCRSAGWPNSIEPSFPDIYSCMKKCSNIDFPKTVYCNWAKAICKDFGVGEEEKEVTISTDKTEYYKNEMVNVIVKNNNNVLLYYLVDPCYCSPGQFGIERYDNDKWIKITAGEINSAIQCHTGACIGCLEIEPGAEKTLKVFQFEKTGKYRLKLDFGKECWAGSYKKSDFEVYSNEFEIKEKEVAGQCSPIDFVGYELVKNYKFDVDLNNDGEKEIVRVYWDSKEVCDKVKPIMVKVFSGTEDCPKEVFSYGWGNQVGKAEMLPNFWGDGSNAVLVEGMSYGCGCGGTIRLLFLAYREGKYSAVEGPEILGLSRLYMFTGENGLGKKIIVAREKWDSDYSDYCCGCSSKRQFMIYTWNGKGYTESKAGITQNKYPSSESIEDIIQKEPSVLNQQ
jgi:hypothetical protein